VNPGRKTTLRTRSSGGERVFLYYRVESKFRVPINIRKTRTKKPSTPAGMTATAPLQTDSGNILGASGPEGSHCTRGRPAGTKGGGAHGERSQAEPGKKKVENSKKMGQRSSRITAGHPPKEGEVDFVYLLGFLWEEEKEGR